MRKTFPSADPVTTASNRSVVVFRRKNGFVFNTIHNIQCNTPTENLLAMFQALGRNV